MADYAVEILTYLSDFKMRIKAVLEDIAALDGWTVFPYRSLAESNKYINIWYGAGTYDFKTEQWMEKTIPFNVDIVAGYRTEGFQTTELSDVHLMLDNIIPHIELALMKSFLDGFITSDFTDPPKYLTALGPLVTSDSGELVELAGGINAQVIGVSLSFNVGIQLNITGA